MPSDKHREASSPESTPETSPSGDVSANANRELSRRVVYERAISHSGPLPAPETLAAYESLLPGLADRIMKLAEGHAKHIQVHETSVLGAAKEQMRWDAASELAGVASAFTLAVLLTLKGYTLVMANHAVAGGVFGGGTITALTTAFILGRRMLNRKPEAHEAAESTFPISGDVPAERP